MDDADIPLARLFAIAFRSLLGRVHDELASRGYHDVGSQFGYVLLATREQPLTGNAIASLMGTSKQATSKLIEAMVSARYVEQRPHPDDARAKLVCITPRGLRLLAVVEDIYRELEREWAAVIGRGELTRLRKHLLVVLRSTHGGVLPPVRPAE